jgi:hypothetical protein
MTASGLRASQPAIRSPLAYALMGLAAVSLLVVGFAIGASRGGSLQANQPDSAAGAPGGRAGTGVAANVRAVPESVTYWLQGRTQSTAAGPALSRGVAPVCSRGTAVSDKPGSVVRASTCEIIRAPLVQTPGPAGLRPESSVPGTGGPAAGADPTTGSNEPSPILRPGVHP